MKKFVYLIEANDTSKINESFKNDRIFKIGYSKNIKRRMNNLQTGTASKLKLINSYKTDNASAIETVLHNTLRSYRIRGEWFILTNEQVEDFINMCIKIDNNIQTLKKFNNPFIK